MNKKKELFREGPFNRENGYVYTHFGQLPQAHLAFDLSLWSDKKDVRALLGRSRLYQKYLQYDRALEDVEAALDVEPDNLTVLQERARVLYLKSEFPHSLLHNYRGYLLRKQPPKFQTGILDCKEAINCCIGKKSGRALHNYYFIIKKLVENDRKRRAEEEANRWKRKIDPKKLKEWYEKIYSHVPRTVKSKRVIKSFGPKSTKEEIQAFLRKIEKQENKQKLIVPTVSNLPRPTTNQFDIQIKPEVPKPYEVQPVQVKTTNIRGLAAEKYLGRLRFDKMYMHNLIQFENIETPNKTGCQTIIKEATGAFNMCAVAQEALRAKNPMYSLRYRELEATKSIIEQNLKELKIVQEVRKNNADMFLFLLRKARENKQLKICLRLVEQAKCFFDKLNEKELPRKPAYVEVVYNIIGLAYLDTLRLDPNKSEEENNNRVKYMINFPLKKIPSYDSLIAEVKPDYLNVKKKIVSYENRIRNATSSLELAWLYHELAKLSIESKRYELGRHYASACVQQSDLIGNEVWAINGNFLIVKANIAFENRNEAHDVLLNMLERSRRIHYPNKNALVEFVQKCLFVLEELDFRTEFSDILKEREKNILNVFAPGPEKENIKRIFRQLSALPTKRRFLIMTGVSMKDDRKISKSQSKSIGKYKIRERLQIPKITTIDDFEAFLEML